MKSTSASVSVDRPIQVVFGFLAEGRNNPIWRSDVSLAARITGTATDLGVGTTYLQKVTDRTGRSVEDTYEITRFEPPHLLEFMATRGSTRTVGRYTLAAINDTTTHVEFTLRRVSPEFRGSQLREHRSELQDRVDFITALPAAMTDEGAGYGIRNVRVFGSAARGDARPDSDIDLLVDFDAERYGLGPLAGFRAEVRDLLDRDVDVATLALLREDVRVEAEAQAVPL